MYALISAPVGNRRHIVTGSGIRTCAAAIALLISSPIASLGGERSDDKPIVIRAGRLLPGGDPVANGLLIVRDGKVEALGADLALPDGARVLEFADGVVTPGLIDAHAAVDPETPQSANEVGRGFFTRLADRAIAESVTAIADKPNQRDPVNDLPPSLAGTRLAGPGADAEHEGHDHAGGAGTCPLCGTRALPPFSLSDASRRNMVEQSAEVVPHARVIDGYNPLSTDFARLLRSGVTTVYMSPDSSAVIGPRGAIVKTGGPIGRRVVRAADAIKVSLGGDPSNRGTSNDLPGGGNVSFYNRRPTTRMGVEWVFRKALFDARRAAAGLPLSGADAPPQAALPWLQELLAGRIPLRMQARMQHDIYAALRLSQEFGLKPVLEEATEAYQCLPALKAAGVPVIFGPLFIAPRGYRARLGEADDPRLSTPKLLLDHGIPFALTANDLRDEDGLVRQAMYAVRFGLPPDAALKAITATPAEVLGLGGQLGVLAPGAAADLVVWSTDPLDATSRPLLVMIDGQVVYEE